MKEYKVSEEQAQLYLNSLSIFSLNCGGILEFLSHYLSEEELNNHEASVTKFVKRCRTISDEIGSGIINDPDNLIYLEASLKYYRDLVTHTKYIFTNMYESDIKKPIIAHEMLISQNLFRIKQHLLTNKVEN